MKSIPTFTAGRFKLRYIQVLYDNRYVVFDYIDSELGNIEAFRVDALSFRRIGYDRWVSFLRTRDDDPQKFGERFSYFLERTKQRDKHLDRTNK